MRTFGVAIVAASLALAGCGLRPGAGAAATVEALYEPYLAGKDTRPPELSSLPLTADLKAQVDKALTYGNLLDTPVLDYDPIVGAQDWQIANLDVTTKGAVGEDGVDVVVRFTNAGAPRELTFLMRLVEGEWRIDDIADAESTLRRRIDAALQPAGEPGAMQAPVRALYERYAASQRIDPLARWAAVTPELRAALTTGASTLDFDPVVDGQDWQLGPVTTEAAASGVIARFDNEGEPKIVVYDLAEENGAWKIANIRSPGRWDLMERLRAVP